MDDNIKVAICAIAKGENLYLREWVDWHKSIGISKIFLYDDNDEGGEKFEDVIGDYIESGFVEVKLGSKKSRDRQVFAYNDFYKSNEASNYDWIAFIDIDEFINTNGVDIGILLLNDIYKDFDVLKLYWKIYGDNGLVTVKNNNYNVRERFKKYKLSIVSKSIIRPNKKVGYLHTHNPHNNIPTCNERGVKVSHICSDHLNEIPTGDIIWLDHYRYKSLEEFLQKIKRGYPYNVKNDPYLTLDNYFHFNEKTPEKIEYLKSIGINYECGIVRNSKK